MSGRRRCDLSRDRRAGDYIDAPGKARWYKFSVTPGQKITVTLSGSPADYDLVVFKDINTGVRQAADSADGCDRAHQAQRRIRAIDVLAVDVQPVDVQPVDVQPDAYAPSTFSPSTFSPSTFAPSTFSPSTFSPSTFSPSTFSPSTFSPSTFSPSTFSSVDVQPVDVLAASSSIVQTRGRGQQAFSSAQTRASSASRPRRAPATKRSCVNTWNETGDFYVRVARPWRRVLDERPVHVERRQGSDDVARR